MTIKSKHMSWRIWFVTIITSILIASCINWTIDWVRTVSSKVETVEQQIENIDHSLTYKKIPNS